MGDTTKCSGLNCDKRDTCKRYCLKASEYQWYADFYLNWKDCEYYIEEK